MLKGKIIPFSLNSSNGISFEIYLSGCNRSPRCEDCHNHELWDYENGNILDFNILDATIKRKYKKFDNFVIMGGEPLDQNLLDLIDFLTFLRQFRKPIWLYTSYELNDVNPNILNLVDYVKTGRYDNTKLTDNNIEYGVKLASNNQKIHKLT